MDKVFVRNFIIFAAILVLCAGTLSFALISGGKELDKNDNWVLHTYEVITKAEQLGSQVEGMLGAQRGYIITKDDDFLDEYEVRKADISNHIASLQELTSGNKSQESRLDEVRNYFNEFSKKLEERARLTEVRSGAEVLTDVEIVDQIKDNIVRINDAILEEEYSLLSERIAKVETQERQYFYTLLVGIVFGTILLFIFNGFLLLAQRKRSRIETSLKDTEERFELAIDGTQDGIFDWDIRHDKVFYSRQFFQMLGYDKSISEGHVDDFKKLLHPEDTERVWQYVEQYLNQKLSEYCQEFRMKNSSGRWIWIQSRAKALYDKNGDPYRMVGAHTDITHLIKAQEKLEAEKKAAEDSNRAKSDFLAHMSHEIRTPLTAITGIAEIFQRNKSNLDDKQKQLITTLNSSTAALKDLINDILDFSKIESGELDLDEKTFELAPLFEEVIQMMSVRANEKGVRFVFDKKDIEENLQFFGDSKRLRQILVNLMGNATKFTDKGSITVKVSCEDREGMGYLHVDVIDTGIGIAEEDIDIVFERFKQADSSVSRRYGGTGLGLPISRNLAKLMGGDILLESQLGKGSKFTLILPINMSYLNKNTVQDNKVDRKLNDKIISSLNEETRILLVEDYEGNIVIVGYMLEEMGFSYDVAKTGEEALELWQEHHYDVVLMDIQMPVMDGFTATKKIREIEEEKNLSHTPIIGMTAHALVGDKDKCIEAGMDSYLSKPLVELDFKKLILKYLKKSSKAA